MRSQWNQREACREQLQVKNWRGEEHKHTNDELVYVRPTSHKGCGSLTAVIQHKVILCIAVLLWTARDEHVVIAKEILEAGNLEGELKKNVFTLRVKKSKTMVEAY